MTIRPNRDGVFPRLLTKQIQKVYTEVAIGNGTQYKIALLTTLNGVFVGINDRGAAEFTGYVIWEYVKEKLALKWNSDARHVADFVNDQLGFKQPRQGAYNAAFCEETAAPMEAM